MSSLKPSKSYSSKNKFLQAVQRLRHLQQASRSSILDCGQLKSQREIEEEEEEGDDNCHKENRRTIRGSRIAIDAFAGKLFAGVSSVKAAYAELQAAQSPFDGEAIRLADEEVVKELRMLSDLKYEFLKKEADTCPPDVSTLLSEIQEQKSLIKTYGITMRSLQSQITMKDSKISSLRSELQDLESKNISSEKKLSSSGFIHFTQQEIMNPSHFLQIINHTIKSVRVFAKLLIKLMQSVDWNIESAAAAAVCDNGEGFEFINRRHFIFAFESFISREMFEGFNRSTFSLPASISATGGDHLDGFRRLKEANPRKFMASREGMEFSAFVRGKYLRLVNPKMERCLFGGLEQRHTVSSGGFPETEFFFFFVEMAKHVWLLHKLAYSMDESPGIFMAKRSCRFSQTFMECVNGDECITSCDPMVAFTVEPGFQLCKTVFQCLVYIHPAL